MSGAVSVLLISAVLSLATAGNGSRPHIPEGSNSSNRSIVLDVRAYADAGVDRSVSEKVRDVARGLLADAGFETRWRICAPEELCPPHPDSRTNIVVLLRATPEPQASRCGLAARRRTAPGGTIWVYLPCVREAALEVTPAFAEREHPSLLSRRHADVAGAVAAHEVGHLLGLGHSEKGLMRADWDARDFVALRRGHLRFSEQQSLRMRLLTELTGAADHTDATAAAADPGLPDD